MAISVDLPTSVPARSTLRHPSIVLLIGIASVLPLRVGTVHAADAGATAPAFQADIEADYDPWAPFNRRMFSFNHDVVDRFIVKPVATAWARISPDAMRRGIDRAIDNVRMPRRLINNLLQGHVLGAGTEAGRFVINTTIGVGGFLDVAERLHLQKHEADMGQTLGIWGLGQGPYLVVPFLAPLTVRDGVGRAVDTALDPLWLVPFFTGTAVGLIGTVNDRSLHLRLFADVEESALDLYSAVRNAYLQHRRAVVTRPQGAVVGAAGGPWAPPRAVVHASSAVGGGA